MFILIGTRGRMCRGVSCLGLGVFISAGSGCVDVWVVKMPTTKRRNEMYTLPNIAIIGFTAL